MTIQLSSAGSTLPDGSETAPFQLSALDDGPATRGSDDGLPTDEDSDDGSSTLTNNLEYTTSTASTPPRLHGPPDDEGATSPSSPLGRTIAGKTAVDGSEKSTAKQPIGVETPTSTASTPSLRFFGAEEDSPEESSPEESVSHQAKQPKPPVDVETFTSTGASPPLSGLAETTTATGSGRTAENKTVFPRSTAKQPIAAATREVADEDHSHDSLPDQRSEDGPPHTFLPKKFFVPSVDEEGPFLDDDFLDNFPPSVPRHEDAPSDDNSLFRLSSTAGSERLVHSSDSEHSEESYEATEATRASTNAPSSDSEDGATRRVLRLGGRALTWRDPNLPWRTRLLGREVGSAQSM